MWEPLWNPLRTRIRALLYVPLALALLRQTNCLAVRNSGLSAHLDLFFLIISIFSPSLAALALLDLDCQGVLSARSRLPSSHRLATLAAVGMPRPASRYDHSRRKCQ